MTRPNNPIICFKNHRQYVKHGGYIDGYVR